MANKRMATSLGLPDLHPWLHLVLEIMLPVIIATSLNQLVTTDALKKTICPLALHIRCCYSCTWYLIFFNLLYLFTGEESILCLFCFLNFLWQYCLTKTEYCTKYIVLDLFVTMVVGMIMLLEIGITIYNPYTRNGTNWPLMPLKFFKILCKYRNNEYHNSFTWHNDLK